MKNKEIFLTIPHVLRKFATFKEIIELTSLSTRAFDLGRMKKKKLHLVA